MNEETAPAYGRFVWHDLMTSDVEASKAFYTALLGWDIREITMAEGAPPYAMIFASAAEDAPGVGGFEVVPPEQGTPPHWMGYVEVDDLQATQGKIEQAGGSILLAPTEIPNVGSFCVAKDPAGGCLAPFQSANERQPDPEPGSQKDGQFVWNELLTRDTETCSAFYPQVIPWHLESMDMPGPDGNPTTYHMFKRGEGGSAPHVDAGMMQIPEGAEAPTHWLHYVQVDDVDATIAKAQELGGAVHAPAMDVAGVGRIGVLADPLGASFAVYKSAPQPASGD